VNRVICLHIHTHTRTYIYTYTYTNTYMHAQIDTQYIHTYPHANIQTDGAGSGEMSMKEVQTQLTLAPGATVVLSACNTGRGKIMGEGVVGLSRGFLFAGAGAVISSLWSVHDESTKELMSVFYSHFSAGRRAPEAMRYAMLQLIHGTLCLTNLEPSSNSGRARPKKSAAQVKIDSAESLVPQPKGIFTHPYYWSAFIVTGASTSISG